MALMLKKELNSGVDFPLTQHVSCSMKPSYAATTCPHDCPSACSLEVELLDNKTIGKVHGARDNSYTEGVICTKVSRYAERVHHPDRLTQPLRRVGAKGRGGSSRSPGMKRWMKLLII